MSILERGSDEEKMDWVSRLWDLDGNGIISNEEMEDMVFSVYDLMGKPREHESISRIAVRAKISNMLEVRTFSINQKGSSIDEIKIFSRI